MTHEMLEIDPCHYQTGNGYCMFYDGDYGTWTLYSPSGEYLETVNDALDEAMIVLDQWSEED